MKLAKRIIAVVGAPALLAGFMWAGSASAKPALTGASLPYTVTFTATVITGTSTATLDSTACTLKGGGGASHSCFLGGSAVFGDPTTASLAIVGDGPSFGPISLSLTEESSSCGDGTALLTSKGPETVNAKATITKVTGTGPSFTVKGTIKIGPNVTGCELQ
jgi:hypothetical protein